MRTSSIISYTALLASSTSLALSFASPADEFDNSSLLRARSFLPDVMPAPAHDFVKRAEGPWDCSEDEEYVPYGDDNDEQDDDDEGEDDDTPVFQPNQGQVKAVAPTTTPAAVVVVAPAPTSTQQQAAKQQESTSSSSSSVQAPSVKNASKAVATPVAAKTSGNVVTPDNIAEGTYTAEEGCARFYTVQAGDICLGLVDKNSDLGLTLDQLYCLNPAIDDLCYNLWIGTSYCVGYNGEEPLNTGVSSSSSSSSKRL